VIEEDLFVVPNGDLQLEKKSYSYQHAINQEGEAGPTTLQFSQEAKKTKSCRMQNNKWARLNLHFG
jgi:hypothetical protein